MAPDLNSLPPSRPLSNLTIGGGHPPSSSLSVNPIMEATRRHDPSPSPRSSSISLAAAATMNAGIQSQRSRRSSSSISGSSRSERPSNANITSVPTSASTTQSLRALPSTNIGDRDPTTGRRRSSILMNLQLANPGLPAAGEMQNQSGATVGGSAAYPPPSPGLATGSPMSSHYPHHRQPSLGEMHQELETEQEAAVVGSDTSHILAISTLTIAV